VVNNGVSAGGGAGTIVASQIIEKDVAAVITGNLGPNAFELLEKLGIKSYSCEVLPASRAIELFKKEQLSEIAFDGKAYHGMN